MYSCGICLCRTMAAGVLPLRAINDLIEESAAVLSSLEGLAEESAAVLSSLEGLAEEAVAVQETMERADRLDGLSETIFVALAVWILIWVIIRLRRKGGE